MNIISFIGENRALSVIERKDGSKIDVPKFVNQARNRYRFDVEQDVMLKQCIDCMNFFMVAHINTNGEWVKNNGDMHEIKTGFRERCNLCLSARKTMKNGTDRFSAKSPRMTKNEREKKTDFKSLQINPDLHHRLRVKAAQEGKFFYIFITEILETALKQ